MTEEEITPETKPEEHSESTKRRSSKDLQFTAIWGKNPKADTCCDDLKQGVVIDRNKIQYRIILKSGDVQIVNACSVIEASQNIENKDDIVKIEVLDKNHRIVYNPDEIEYK